MVAARLLFALMAVCLVTNVSCAQQKQITILHTNDLHSNFIPREAVWSRETPKPFTGGFKELFFVSDSIKKVKSTLMLDAGDVMTGNPITEYEYNGAFGGALFEMMNLIGYDAWTPGNHEFDISQNNLVNLTKIAKFPTLSANLVHDKGVNHLNNIPYLLTVKDRLKIGIVGIITQDLYGLVNQSNLVGVRVLSPVETIQKIIDEIDTKTDLIIALTHQGVYDDSILAANVNGLDVIVGGHSHTRLTRPKVVNDVIIVQAGTACDNLGELELTVENDKVVKYFGKLIPLWERKDRPENRLTMLVDSMKNKIDKDYSEVIGELKSDWKRASGESGMGNFITDVQREAAQADVAFMNNHGMRKDISAGPITKRDVFEVLPFRNILTVFELSGKEIKSIIKNYIQKGTPIQFSGVKSKYRKVNNDIEFVEVEIQGKPVDDDKLYKCAANDYFVGEARRYLGMEITKSTQLNLLVFDEVIKAVKKTKIIDAKIENRIIEIQK